MITINQIILETQQYKNGQITKLKSEKFSIIKRINNFITFKNNNLLIKGAVFKKGCKSGWGKIMIDKNMLVNPTSIQNFSRVITNNPLRQHSISNESEDLSQTIVDGLDLYIKDWYMLDLNKRKQIIKEKLKFLKYRSEASHQSVTSSCTYRSNRIISTGGSI